VHHYHHYRNEQNLHVNLKEIENKIFDSDKFDILPREPALHTFPPSLGGLVLLNDIAKYIE